MRIRWQLHLKQLLVTLVGTFLLLIRTSQKVAYPLVLVFFICVLLWWTWGGHEPYCDAIQVQEQICQEFKKRNVAGKMCADLCTTGVLELTGCGESHGSSQIYEVLVNGRYGRQTGLWSNANAHILEGTLTEDFEKMVITLLERELGPSIDGHALSKKMLKDFDQNTDSKLNYGEAHSLWMLLHQPHFLNFYLFQDHGVVPHLNGTCGNLAIFSDYQRDRASCLFSRSSPWLLWHFVKHAFRMTLPPWTLRAKIMLSLLEWTEEIYEKEGARFHMCNVSEENLFYYRNHEILISPSTMLVSNKQIKNFLSNRTCLRDQDCRFTEQCVAKCDYSTHKCLGQLVHPTIRHICSIMDDYLLFDAPKTLKPNLTKSIRKCQELSWSVNNVELVHSILIIDIKNVLWGYVQNIKL